MSNRKKNISFWSCVLLLIICLTLAGKTIAQTGMLEKISAIGNQTTSSIKQLIPFKRTVNNEQVQAQNQSQSQLRTPAQPQTPVPSNVIPNKDINADNVPENPVTFEQFVTAFKDIQNYYYEPVSDSTLYSYAIRGMLSGLDPHSGYLDPQDVSDLRDITTGKFGGIGLEVTPDNGFLRVISPIDDTPAQKAGLQPGDLIVLVNTTPIMNVSFREAVKMMRGEKGTWLTLTVIRQGHDQPMQFKMQRADIQVKSVKSKTLEPGYGYIRVSSFQDETGSTLIKAINDLKAANNNQLKGVVLDLRNNPGGLLNAAITVADAFLDKSKLNYNGLIVYTKGRAPNSLFSATADGTDYLNGAPMVVLVNAGSASGAEIVAGALQDYHRAIIMGTDTFGKGSVQTVIPLSSDSAMKLTTALYFTPAGRSIQAEGIKPDIIIESLKVTAPNQQSQALLNFLKESNLKDHLANANVAAASKQNNIETVKQNTAEISSELLASQDYQLAQALNLLKGLNIVNQKGNNS